MTEIARGQKARHLAAELRRGIAELRWPGGKLPTEQQLATEQGVSVIVISHNMEHVMQVADRAVVLRQGRYIGEEKPSKETHERLVGMIVGGDEDREPDAERDEEERVAQAEPALRQPDRACSTTLSHSRRTSCSDGLSPWPMRTSSSRTSRPTAADATTTSMTAKSAEIIANTAPTVP